MEGSAHSYLKTMSGSEVGYHIARLKLEGRTAREAADYLDKYGPIPVPLPTGVTTNGWKPAN